jgi:hypothetical protein
MKKDKVILTRVDEFIAERVEHIARIRTLRKCAN